MYTTRRRGPSSGSVGPPSPERPPQLPLAADAPRPPTVHKRKCWELNTPNNGGTNRINSKPHQRHPHQRHPRRRTILPYDDPHAPRRNDSDPCLRQFDGVQLTHINGTKPRPALTTIPVYLNETDDPRGTYCMIRLFIEAHPKKCTLLGNLFPPGLNKTTPPTFTAQPAPYWCFTRTLAWTCTIVRLTVPVTVFVQSSNATNNTAPQRPPASFDLTQNSPCYIDAIGIPRGVPNEYKLADQIGAGFENIPLLSALFPITPNKNVDRINYIHYNVQRLANLTRDAVEGISTQLAATSLMAFQNRVALDMLLAEKGGVYAMFGDQCCTFIPNNTAPDGSVTKALNGLRALSTELKEASGLDNPLEAWMQGLFGRWKALVMAVLTSLACFLAILITCGCCCIPCARTLCVRLIATALSKENAPRDYEHQMVSLLVEPLPDDDEESYCDMTLTVY
ncbi:Endogenous retrovirus group V member 2 Env polyprotein [Merluccius polli]|uniref:Endogenous retrovirus group V member 2 Env polyprotein n=1 Tax=Merluccius polli TaxID=89951 RepID=A0AA47NBL6_MERPO|nr:Endogenous retrovirus group V member 2 Env polyprotein [Merluccius polli]